MPDRTPRLDKGVRKPRSANRSTDLAVERLARLASGLVAADAAILRSRSQEALYQGICNATVDTGQFLMTAVTLAEANRPG